MSGDLGQEGSSGVEKKHMKLAYTLEVSNPNHNPDHYALVEVCTV